MSEKINYTVKSRWNILLSEFFQWKLKLHFLGRLRLIFGWIWEFAKILSANYCSEPFRQIFLPPKFCIVQYLCLFMQTQFQLGSYIHWSTLFSKSSRVNLYFDYIQSKCNFILISILLSSPLRSIHTWSNRLLLPLFSFLAKILHCNNMIWCAS